MGSVIEVLLSVGCTDYAQIPTRKVEARRMGNRRLDFQAAWGRDCSAALKQCIAVVPVPPQVVGLKFIFCVQRPWDELRVSKSKRVWGVGFRFGSPNQIQPRSTTPMPALDLQSEAVKRSMV